MEASQDHSICWNSEEKFLIFTTENTPFDSLGLILFYAQFLLLQESL